MQISILIPTFRRPHQLAEALESLAWQERSLIGEILIGDDSPPEFRAANQAVIAQSEVATLVNYFPNQRPLGNYPNQCALGELATCDHVLILHDDDQLCPGGLAALAGARLEEADERVRIWFGRDQIMDADGQVNREKSRDNALHFGKAGDACAKPVWDWCLTQSLPPNSALICRDTYLSLMRGKRDGNVGDWGLHVRLANSGAWGRFIGRDVSRYRVQPESITGSNRGIDVHYMYEMASELRVPDDRLPEKQKILRTFAEVATTRYLREGERHRAWRCFASGDWRWKRRLSKRGVATMVMLLSPATLWRPMFKGG